jgi:hypothetical protein
VTSPAGADSLTLRVSRGMALLDRLDPDWWRPGIPAAIDLESLRMEDPALCVLTQRYGRLAKAAGTGRCRRRNGYLAGLRMLGICENQAAAHGFTGVDADLLTPAWRQAIALRRARATDRPGDLALREAPEPQAGRRPG